MGRRFAPEVQGGYSHDLRLEPGDDSRGVASQRQPRVDVAEPCAFAWWMAGGRVCARYQRT